MRYDNIGSDRPRPGLPTTARVLHSRAYVETMLLLALGKTRREREEEGE